MTAQGICKINYHMIITALIAATGGLLFGYDTGIISGAILFIPNSFPLSTLMQEVIVTAVVAGAFTGSITSGRLVDHFGSQRILRYMAVTFIIGSLMTSFANSVYVIILGRFILGLAIGVTSFLSPLFIAEMAPAKHRGRFVLLNVLMITGGEAVAFLVDYLLIPTQSWRLMFLTCTIPALALFIGTLFLPPSPRWLALKGDLTKARQIMQRVRGTANVEAELNDILTQASLSKANWRELFSVTMRHVLIIGIALGIFQQFAGINAVMYYGPTIFAAMGFASNSDQLLSTFALGCVNSLVTILTLLLVDKLGRRRLLLTGLVIACLSLLISGYFTSQSRMTISPWLGVISMIGYIIGYSMSLGSIFWLIISEIYPLNMRGLGMSCAATTQWGANIIITMTFLSLMNLLGAALLFWLFSAVCAISFLFCYLFVPETSGISLEQIEKNLRYGKSSRHLGDPLIEST